MTLNDGKKISIGGKFNLLLYGRSFTIILKKNQPGSHFGPGWASVILNLMKFIIEKGQVVYKKINSECPI